MRTLDHIDRIDLLYDPLVLERAMEEHGSDPYQIKHAVETTAKMYEIAAAKYYWFVEDQKEPRGTRSQPSRSVWRRLRWHDKEGIPPQECEQI